jgi:hypothetical protein
MQSRYRSQPAHISPLHSGPVTSEIAEQQGTGRWGKRQTLAAVAVAAVIGGLGGAAVYAATEGSPHTMGAGMHRPMHGPPPPGAPPVPLQPAPAGVLHSEYVVSDGQGGFSTKMTQTGTVDEITLSSIVVRSDDGYAQIYAFPSSAVVPKPSLAANDTVTVQATRTGPTVTLNSIGEGPPHGS